MVSIIYPTTVQNARNSKIRHNLAVNSLARYDIFSHYSLLGFNKKAASVFLDRLRPWLGIIFPLCISFVIPPSFISSKTEHSYLNLWFWFILSLSLKDSHFFFFFFKLTMAPSSQWLKFSFWLYSSIFQPSWVNISLCLPGLRLEIPLLNTAQLQSTLSSDSWAWSGG